MIRSLHGVFADFWAEASNIRLSDVVEKTVELDPEFEVTGGRYDLKNNPFWREPIDNFLNDDVSEISVMKSTRVGGTLTLNAVALALSKVAPASGMLVVPDELEAKESRNRIYGTAESSLEYKDQIPPERWRNMSEISLANGSMKVKLAWSGSAQRLRGKTIKYLLRSEIDVFAATTSKGGDPLKASYQRTGRIPNFKVYDESTPDGDPSNIHTRYMSGNQSEWHCPCPHCGTYQPLNFFTQRGKGGFVGYTDTDDPRHKDAKFLPIDEVRTKTFYRCVNGCNIYTHQKHGAVVNGVWVPKGCRTTKKGVVTGTPEQSRRHSSYYLWKVHVRDFSLGEIACNYVTAYKDGKLKDFWQNDVGRRWRVGRKVHDWKKLGARLQVMYSRGSVPKDAYFLTAGVDVQMHGCYYQVWAWGDGASHWLIEWGYVQRYEGSEDASKIHLQQDEQGDVDEITSDNITSDLKQLDTILVGRKFKVEGGECPLGKKYHQCSLINCDTNYRTRDVQQWVYYHHPWQKDDDRYDHDDVVRCVRGDHKVKRSEKYKPSTVEAPKRGGLPYIGGMRLWHIYNIHYKDEWANRCIMSRGSRGSIGFPKSILKEGEDFLKQMTNERKVDKEDKNTKRTIETYVIIDRAVGNHYPDGYGYAFAAADMHLDRRNLTWDASTWGLQPELPAEDQEAIETVAAREYME